ncbi:MAG: DUF433 domain-containing protein [Anaerolineae bacterium]
MSAVKKLDLPSEMKADQIVYYDKGEEGKLALERDAFETRHLRILKARADQVSGVTVDEEIMGGDPVITGTRIPVYNIISHLAEGYTPSEIIAHCYPDLTLEQIKAAVRFAALMTTLDTFEDLSEDELAAD